MPFSVVLYGFVSSKKTETVTLYLDSPFGHGGAGIFWSLRLDGMHTSASRLHTTTYKRARSLIRASLLLTGAQLRQGFDSSGPIGALTPTPPAKGGGVGAAAGLVGDEGARRIWLEVGGGRRQDSVLGEMVWSVPEMIARLSEVRGARGRVPPSAFFLRTGLVDGPRSCVIFLAL